MPIPFLLKTELYRVSRPTPVMQNFDFKLLFATEDYLNKTLAPIRYTTLDIAVPELCELFKGA